MKSRFLVPTVLAAALALCTAAQSPAKPAHGVQVSYLDTAVKPCDDFYEYANGAWLKSAKIPPEYPLWGAAVEVYERNLAIEKAILEEASKNSGAPKGSTVQKVGDFYASGMNEAAIEKAGRAPLASRFEQIGEVKDGRALAAEFARLHLEGCDAGFTFGVGVDDKVSTAYIAQFSQGGLGLPDRDYYTKDDEGSKALRAHYLLHVAKMFELLGDEPAAAKKNAETVMAMETRLAKASMTQVELRDPNAIYHKMTRQELVEAAPGFQWEVFFKDLGLPPSQQTLLVRQPAFFTEFGAMARTVPMEEWRAYLRWNLISSTGSYLSSPFVNERFAFYGKVLSGTQELRPRWKRVQSATDAALGEAVGQLYVAKAFSPEAKAKALDLVKNLQSALREKIRQVDWMTPETKQKAFHKLDVFIVKIGYPDKWRDYSGLEISRGPYVLNVLAARTFESRRNLAKLGKPVDRSEWLMNVQDVNAYYEPTTNEICFPAGILQPPLFDALADDACNYGGIGTVIGHEMTHGFDDQGCQYDAEGNLKNWWTEEDTKAYQARQALVVKQFDGYKVLPDLAINGELTLGENIADLGGLKIAFAAFQKSMEGKPRPAPIDGFTPEQRFFLNYAQAWQTLMRPEFLRMIVNTDPHSPPKYRVIGPLSNLPEFYTAFGCGEKDPMWTATKDRPAIW